MPSPSIDDTTIKSGKKELPFARPEKRILHLKKGLTAIPLLLHMVNRSKFFLEAFQQKKQHIGTTSTPSTC